VKVFVYFNLHRKCWSVKALEGPMKGRVIQHTDNIVLSSCIFKVSEAGRQRVLKERRKNVHAGVVGTIVEPSSLARVVHLVPVAYNPYKADTFVTKPDDAPIHAADVVFLQHRQVLSASWL
jgi:hypothetical protein